MIAPFSERARAGHRRRLADRRGSILVMTAVMMLAMLGLGGLAIDMGQLYVARQQLSAVADASALAAARVSRLGQTRARAAASTIAIANGLPMSAQVSVNFATDNLGRQTVRVTATQNHPLMLGRMLGLSSANIVASATATGPPVDLVMVIDQSYSLEEADAWDDLEIAAKEFVGFFGDTYDQLSLVSFHTRGVKRTNLAKNFKTPVRQKIDAMSSIGVTNMSEGLRLAREELNSGRAQTGSLKAVIFFTDGWANTYRTRINGRDMLLSVLTQGANPIYGKAIYFLNPDTYPVDGARYPDGECEGGWNAICPGTQTVTKVLADSRAAALARATQLRADGVYVYTIGMKDAASNTEPDMDYLRLMANENGIAAAGQPQAKAYYAPSSAQLREIFTRVASDMMVHLVE